MSTSEELPEYQIFSVLRQGEEEPIGPYSQNQLVELLNAGQIRASDLVHYPDLAEWTPIGQVFDITQDIANLEDHGQDQHLLNETFTHLSAALGPDESIYYIATQHSPALTLTSSVRLTQPKSFAVTDLHFFIGNHKLAGGVDFEIYHFSQVCSAQKRIKHDEKRGIFSILLQSGERVETDKIPALQLGHLEHHATQLLAAHQAAEATPS